MPVLYYHKPLCSLWWNLYSQLQVESGSAGMSIQGMSQTISPSLVQTLWQNDKGLIFGRVFCTHLINAFLNHSISKMHITSTLTLFPKQTKRTFRRRFPQLQDQTLLCCLQNLLHIWQVRPLPPGHFNYTQPFILIFGHDRRGWNRST